MNLIQINHYPISPTPGPASLLRLLLLVNLILSPFAQFAPASTAPVSPRPDGPQVVMGSIKRDFGEVFAGEELEQNFPVQNAGNKPLELALKSTLGARPIQRKYLNFP